MKREQKYNDSLTSVKLHFFFLLIMEPSPLDVLKDRPHCITRSRRRRRGKALYNYTDFDKLV